MWIIVDTHRAIQQGIHFRLLPNDVVVTTGVRGWIPPDCIAAIWKDQDVKYDLDQFRSEKSLLAKQATEGAHPRPYNREVGVRPRPDTIRVPLDSDDNATTARGSPVITRKRLAPSDVTSGFTPRSPSEEDLDKPEADRPPSWYPQDDTVGNRQPLPKMHRPCPPSSSQDTVIVSNSMHTDNSEPFLGAPHPFVKSKPLPRLTPNQATITSGEMHRYIQDSVQQEVEKRMDLIRNTVGRSIDAARNLTTAPSPANVAVPPEFPGFLNCPPTSSTTWLVPRCQVTPTLTPYYPPEATMPADYQPNSWNAAIEHQDDDDPDYMPKSLEECMLDAYSFALTFHPRAIPPYPTGKWVASTPTQRVIIDKRHKARVKRAQQPLSVQKTIQWNALMRRAQRAASTGNVSLTRVVVRANEVFGKIRVILEESCVRWSRYGLILIRMCIIMGVMVRGWEFSATEVGVGYCSAIGSNRCGRPTRTAVAFSLSHGRPGRAQLAFPIVKRCVRTTRAVSAFSVRAWPGRALFAGEVKKNPHWGRYFVMWLACFWVPSPTHGRDSRTKTEVLKRIRTREQTRSGGMQVGQVYFPPSWQGADPLRG